MKDILKLPGTCCQRTCSSAGYRRAIRLKGWEDSCQLRTLARTATERAQAAACRRRFTCAGGWARVKTIFTANEITATSSRIAEQGRTCQAA
jgi:hypothetical protein